MQKGTLYTHIVLASVHTYPPISIRSQSFCQRPENKTFATWIHFIHGAHWTLHIAHCILHTTNYPFYHIHQYLYAMRITFWIERCVCVCVVWLRLSDHPFVYRNGACARKIHGFCCNRLLFCHQNISVRKSRRIWCQIKWLLLFYIVTWISIRVYTVTESGIFGWSSASIQQLNGKCAW